jgi:hypothetical protein
LIAGLIGQSRVIRECGRLFSQLDPFASWLTWI